MQTAWGTWHTAPVALPRLWTSPTMEFEKEMPAIAEPLARARRAAESEGKDTDLKLLTDEERAWLATRPTFVDHVEQYAVQSGYDQLSYFRATGWKHRCARHVGRPRLCGTR